MAIICKRISSLDYSKLPQPISFSSLMVNFTKRQMMSLWARPLALAPMANVSMCRLVEKLTRDGFMLHLYKSRVDNTLERIPSVAAAAAAVFLSTLNGRQLSVTFTTELPLDDKIPFIGIEMVKNRTEIETQVYSKPTNPGLLLHHSHTDNRYKDSLLKTTIHQAYALSSTTLT